MLISISAGTLPGMPTLRAFLVALLATALLHAQKPSAEALDHFETRIRPALAKYCYACHSAKAPVAQGGLRLDSAHGLHQGGNRGPAAPQILRALRHTDPELKMPPGKPLPPEIIKDFEQWLIAGAPYPEAGPANAPRTGKWWAFRPIVKPQGAHTIDSLAQPTRPPADRRTLLRRAYLDVTGLPPTYEEVQAFQNDPSPDAWPRRVDELLASPHYGERWARRWLDVARYSDQLDLDIRYPFSFTYRDWVIRALNQDLPYDRFLRLQLAADLDPSARQADRAALGFVTLGRNYLNNEPENIDDRIDALTRGAMGLTVACARCHDHKYDPVPTRNYYALYGVFMNSAEHLDPAPIEGADDPARKQVFEREMARRLKDIDDYRRTRYEILIKELQQPAQVLRYLFALTKSRALSPAALEEFAKEQDLNLELLRRWLRYTQARPVEPTEQQAAALLKDPANPMNVPFSEMKLIQTEGDNNNLRDLRLRAERVWIDFAYRGAAPRATALKDADTLRPAHVFVRGNPNNKGVETPPQFLDILCEPACAPWTTKGSGRWDLANAVTSPSNPLTARVIVNRIWAWYFGEGLVKTPSDFGARSDPPANQKLLDWLAATLIEENWSLKKLHRRILLSATYQQSGLRKRLDFESLRDSMLAVSGQLDRTQGGLPFELTASPAVPRRTVYAYIDRTRLPGVLQTFDFPSAEQHSPARFTTTTAPQALFLMNNPFVAEQAQALAARASGIAALYRATLQRDPTPAERTAAEAFLNDPAAATGAPAAGTAAASSLWSYYLGPTPLAYFVHDAWQPSPILPDKHAGEARLTADGGVAPDNLQPLIRRWTAPAKGRIDISGVLRHSPSKHKNVDGIRARIVSSRQGELATYTVNGREDDTNLRGLEVEPGEYIDFAVDGRQDAEADRFSWSPTIKQGDHTYSARASFRGPAPKPLTRIEQLAQVLLSTNEFAFID
ncbi:MAG: PSD1 and planctomycete cytochrome C domain-containing protein [Bryobacteraceae bacterium]|nr:PSD1 and planctomycete cytochrome C domain-containing protein [Bryobacteraceae bacterium]